MHTTKTNTSKRRVTKLIAGVAAIAVIASACGSDDGSSPSGEALTGAANDTVAEQAEGDSTIETQAASGGALVLPATVTYFDWEWEVHDAFVSPLVDDTSTEEDDDPNTDYLQVPVTITNRSTDFGVSGLRHKEALRLFLLGDDLPVKADTIWDDWDGAHSKQTSSMSLGFQERVERQWSFPVPAGTDPATVVIEIGLPDDTKQVIPTTGPLPADPTAPVALAQTSFGGEYSYNAVDFVVLESFASLNRGLYDDNSARPGGTDRRADEGNVFVIIELQADQMSTSAVSGVNPGAHEVITDDGNTYKCKNDAPGLYGGETIVYTASCEVPLDATSYTFQMRTDKCAGGCNSVDHMIAIDPSFVEAFS